MLVHREDYGFHGRHGWLGGWLVGGLIGRSGHVHIHPSPAMLKKQASSSTTRISIGRVLEIPTDVSLVFILGYPECGGVLGCRQSAPQYSLPNNPLLRFLNAQKHISESDFNLSLAKINPYEHSPLHSTFQTHILREREKVFYLSVIKVQFPHTGGLIVISRHSKRDRV